MYTIKEVNNADVKHGNISLSLYYSTNYDVWWVKWFDGYALNLGKSYKAKSESDAREKMKAMAHDLG